MPKKKTESATVRACRLQLRKRMKAVGLERDRLRELAGEYATLADTCDEAVDSLRDAVASLSKYA